MKQDLIEAVQWFVVLFIFGAVIFNAILWFPRLQYKYCFNEYLKAQENTSQGYAYESCEDWIK